MYNRESRGTPRPLAIEVTGGFREGPRCPGESSALTDPAARRTIVRACALDPPPRAPVVIRRSKTSPRAPAEHQVVDDSDCTAVYASTGPTGVSFLRVSLYNISIFLRRRCTPPDTVSSSREHLIAERLHSVSLPTKRKIRL